MPAATRSSLVHKHNALLRYRTPDDPVVVEARRDLKAAGAVDYITRLVDEAPPLTAGQIGQLQAILATAHDEVLDATGLIDCGNG